MINYSLLLLTFSLKTNHKTNSFRPWMLIGQ